MPGKINVFNNAASLSVAPAFAPFTGVRLWIDSNNFVFAGDETGRVLEEDCPWATKEMAENTLDLVKGYVYQPYEATGALVDPAAELGDFVTVGDIYGPLVSMDTVFDAACASDISAPSEEGAEIEYRVVPRKDRINDRKFAETRSLITKTADEIRLEVFGEDGAFTKLSQTVDSISAEIYGEDGMFSSLSQKVDSFTLSVSNDEASSTIQLMAGETIISSQTIKFTGDVVFESDLKNGNTTISGDCITTGTILAERLQLGGEMYIYDSPYENADEAGYFGYLEGSIYGSDFVGCGIISLYDTAVLMSEDDDVLIAAYNDIGIYTGTNGKVLIDSEYLIPTIDDHTYCGSYSYWWYDGYFDTLHVGGAEIETSDRRKKENVNYDLTQYLEVFDQLKPCSYKLIKGQRTHLGMIAQEVEEAASNAGIDLEHFAAVCIDRENDVYGLRYSEFVPLLIAKVKQLEAEIKELKIA